MEYREPSDIEIFTWDKGSVIRDNSLIAIDTKGSKEYDLIISIGQNFRV